VGALHREASWPLAGCLSMSFSAPSDTFPLPMMCLEVRARNLSSGDQAMRALCRARHTEYVQEPIFV
jgi:hypothetical protein